MAFNGVRIDDGVLADGQGIDADVLGYALRVPRLQFETEAQRRRKKKERQEPQELASAAPRHLRLFLYPTRRTVDR